MLAHQAVETSDQQYSDPMTSNNNISVSVNGALSGVF